MKRLIDANALPVNDPDSVPTGKWVRFEDIEAAAPAEEPSSFLRESRRYWRKQASIYQRMLEKIEAVLKGEDGEHYEEV